MFWQLRMRKHRQAPISPKFVKLEVRNHRQAPISPKFPKAQQLRPLTPHRCQDFRNFGEIRAWRCFGTSSFTNLGEIRAWRCLGNLGCENTARLEFPKIPETWNAKVIEEQLYHVLMHEPSIASVQLCSCFFHRTKSDLLLRSPLLNKRNRRTAVLYNTEACLCLWML